MFFFRHPTKKRGYSYCWVGGLTLIRTKHFTPCLMVYIHPPMWSSHPPHRPLAPPTMKSSGLLVPSRRQRGQPWMVSGTSLFYRWMDGSSLGKRHGAHRPMSLVAASWIDPPGNLGPWSCHGKCQCHWVPSLTWVVFLGQGALSNEESTTSDRNGTILEIVKVVS